ncbi:hypothetical protein G4X40_03415 [Rhodococcus sp. D2-41]|uniref:Uncharacterized protein n=1 Tax=Speluncibacter jeojiensis TaxID=2710754 RepID=A0A9X4M2R8_9ACTN|nr:hypothetical protein [Rhodococcus sp. D2-41]MDG3009190.1 hypothetical protein [Rhodococcus sp. D2-41]MDG3016136.1 hypothetical protein [Corynebacteriales bacterium D3-21]
MTSPYPIPEQLPPCPDAQTGLPRPPQAPRGYKGKNRTPTNRIPRKAPPPPEGQGPRIEWFQESNRSSLVAGGLTIVFMAAFFTLRNGFGWATNWAVWLTFFLTGLAIFSCFRNSWVAAGARWLQWRKAGWVDVYTLTKINIRASGPNAYIDLADSAGRSISPKLSDIQDSQRIWDLVYNGIVHSVANGTADPDRKTRLNLKLPPRP